MKIAIPEDIPFRHYPWFLNLQVVNLVLPLIGLPYLLRTIGPRNYGFIAFATAIGMSVTTISEYGFAFIGTKEIAQRSDHKDDLSEYISLSIILRLILFLPLFLLISVAALIFSESEPVALLIILAMLSLLPGMFYSQWIYIGLETIREYNLIMLANRIISLLLLFVIVRRTSDYVYYPLTNLLPAILSACMSFALFRRAGMIPTMPSRSAVKKQFREGFFTFLSQSTTLFYTQTNPLLLMFLIKDSMLVGYYALAEKIVVSVRSIISPLNQLYLPVISKSFMSSIPGALLKAKQFALVSGAIHFTAFIILNVFATYIVQILAGDQFLPSVGAIRYLSPIIFLIALNNIAGVHVMLNLNLTRLFFIGILIGMALNLVCTISFVPFLSYRSSALSWSISEAAVLAFFVWSIHAKQTEEESA